jgi:type I restriction enzyme M protein
MEKATQLQAELGSEQSDDFNQFDLELKEALKTTDIKLDTREKKQLLDAVTWKNPEAKQLIKKVVKSASQPFYGAFCYNGSLKSYKGKVVEYQTDGDLRNNENVPLDPAITNAELIETYFKKEVVPHVADAWINADKRDAKDKEIGIVGYEIPFNRHFYQYQPPRDLAEIDADLDAVSADIMKLLQEVHS